ncbi:MAG: hypothetical protein Q8R07_03135 [Candidatus Uhrbacteria bacterium]|nr:hypothetical protein [Candidatus Uhrbacteria bacterium]
MEMTMIAKKKDLFWIAIMLGLLGVVFLDFGCGHTNKVTDGPEGHYEEARREYGVWHNRRFVDQRLPRYAACMRERERQITRTGMRHEDVQAVCYCETTAKNVMDLQACGMGLRVAVTGTWGTPAYSPTWMAASQTPPPPTPTPSITTDAKDGRTATTAELKTVGEFAMRLRQEFEEFVKTHKAKGGTP